MTITNLRALRNTLDIDVVKASCFGNNFLIYDGTNEGILEEVHFPEFARQVTDPQFGIGADNFLVIQNCNADELQAINNLHGYWKKIPALRADYVFRMFEPDGQEALCCGNGLMCIANYMAERHQVENASIMTEIPLAKVNVTTIGFTRSNPMVGSIWEFLENSPTKFGRRKLPMAVSVKCKLSIICASSLELTTWIPTRLTQNCCWRGI